jgi:protein phosphatase
LLEALTVANRQVFTEARVAGIERTMGAACTACLIRGDRAYFAQVGDSRGYLLRGRTLYQTTWDQPTNVSPGQMSGEHARMTAHAETLLHALGAADTVDAMVVELDLLRGDRILLCTDGLHHVLPLDDIRAALVAEDDPPVACARLIRAAVERGAPENLTAVVARCEGPVFPAASHDGGPAYRLRLLSRR